MPKMTMRDGARLHYLDIGRGAPIVLLHGFAMQAAMWLPFVAPLAHRHRFIIPDLRGFGFSHRLKLSHALAIDQHAHDLHDLMNGLRLGRVRLAGLSMGACTALQYNVHYGFDRVSAYLHMDQAPCVPNLPDWQHGLMGESQARWFAEWNSLIAQIGACGHDQPYEQLPLHLRRQLFSSLGHFIGHAFHQPAWRTLRHFASRETLMRRVAPIGNWPIYLDTMNAYVNGGLDWRPTMSRIKAPVTVMIGMQSQLYAAEGQAKFADYVPQAHLVRVQNCGHVVPFEAPARFVRELARFLAGARSPRLAEAA